jgi:hypothetical protein
MVSSRMKKLCTAASQHHNNDSNCNAKGPSLQFGRGGMLLRFSVDPVASLEILWYHSIGQCINFVGAKLPNLRISAQIAAEQVPMHESGI